MLHAARKARRLAARSNRESLEDEDNPVADALIRLVSLIGEAAGRLSEESQALLPEIPWPDVIGMRHRLIHGYFDVNLDILWATVQDSLPPLIGRLETALAPDQ